MGQIGTADVIDRVWAGTTFAGRAIPAQQSVLIVRDADENSDLLESVCEFLDISVEHATTGDDLRAILPMLRPMAVIADLDGEIQDGFHVMKMIGKYDPALPILLLNCNDPAMLGAVDAVQEIWGMTRVVTAAAHAGIGVLVDFICHAARDSGRPRLMRV